jgi:hypothetical protein
MWVSCVRDLKQLGAEKADVIVFPEGVSQAELQEAGLTHLDAIVAGAFEEGGHCRAL